jgi:hypothetical protein
LTSGEPLAGPIASPIVSNVIATMVNTLDETVEAPDGTTGDAELVLLMS